MCRSFSKANALLLLGCALMLCLVIGWSLYGFFGQSLIASVYRSESIGLLNSIMEGRAATPLEHYHQEADRLMVLSTSWIIASYLLLVLLVKKPLGLILACCSVLFSFSSLFLFLEIFPSLVHSLHLDFIDYYAYRINYIPDDELVYKEKPVTNTRFSSFRGTAYSPEYNIHVEPTTIEWKTDQDGFRNSHATKSADIVVLGDSFIEYGDNESDTFGKRLEKKLSGLTVVTLGKAGYGPFQYLEVLKRYGISKQPKDVLFGFYEGNDLKNIEEYLEWKSGQRVGEYGQIYTALTGSFLQRYIMALSGTIRFIEKQTSLLVRIGISKIWQSRGYIHPKVIVVKLENTIYRMLFVPELNKNSTEELLAHV